MYTYIYVYMRLYYIIIISNLNLKHLKVAFVWHQANHYSALILYYLLVTYFNGIWGITYMALDVKWIDVSRNGLFWM